MEFCEPHLILQGADDRFVIGAHFWDEVVSWAVEHGWVSDAGSEGGRTGPCRSYSDEESRRLADALDVIGGNLVLQSQVSVPDEFLAELAEALSKLQTFAESGGFSVRPWHPAAESGLDN
jgi:hypothetical protein